MNAEEIIALAFVLANMLAPLLYWQDKRAARAGGWRVPEANLLMLALLGGWPMSIWAQKKFRHKTKKTAFRWRFFVCVGLWGVACAYWFIIHT